MHKEDRRIESGVFDEYTKKAIYEVQSKGYFDTLDSPISTGKEADVFKGTVDEEENKFVAVKVYRIETTGFNKMRDYLMYDPRFQDVKSTKRGLIKEWCKKEFRNLRDANEVGVKCPNPVKAYKNVLVMELIHNGEGNPCPLMKNVLRELEDPAEVIGKIREYMDILYEEAELVHSDLSEFNVLIQNQKPVLIDMGQAISVKHPMAKEFLERDKRNIDKLAEKIGVK